MAEAFLRQRGLRPGADGWSWALGYLSAVDHAASGLTLSALVGAVQVWDKGEDVVAVHLLYLAPDGAGLAPVSPTRVTIGNIGAGAIRLGYPDFPHGSLGLCRDLLAGLELLECWGPIWCRPTGLYGVKVPFTTDVELFVDRSADGDVDANDGMIQHLSAGRRCVVNRRPPRCASWRKAIQAATVGRWP